jgi:hypothetical protein
MSKFLAEKRKPRLAAFLWSSSVLFGIRRSKPLRIISRERGFPYTPVWGMRSCSIAAEPRRVNSFDLGVARVFDVKGISLVFPSVFDQVEMLALAFAWVFRAYSKSNLKTLVMAAEFSDRVRKTG